jgi:hypothetical protein
VAGSLPAVRDEGLAAYDFGGGHPLAPIGAGLAVALAREPGVLDAPGASVTGTAPVRDDLPTLVHDAGYLAAVRRAAPDIRHGLGTGDNPVLPGMHETSTLVVEASNTIERLPGRLRPGRATRSRSARDRRWRGPRRSRGMWPGRAIRSSCSESAGRGPVASPTARRGPRRAEARGRLPHHGRRAQLRLPQPARSVTSTRMTPSPTLTATVSPGAPEPLCQKDYRCAR